MSYVVIFRNAKGCEVDRFPGPAGISGDPEFAYDWIAAVAVDHRRRSGEDIDHVSVDIVSPDGLVVKSHLSALNLVKTPSI